MLKTRFPDPSELSLPVGGSQASNAIIQRQRLRNQLEKIKSTLDPHDLYHPQQEYYPDLLFVFNKSPSRLMSYSSAQTLQHTLDVFFPRHPFKTIPFMRPDVLVLSQNDPEYDFNPSLSIDEDLVDNNDGDTENDGEEVPSGADDGTTLNNGIEHSSPSPMSANLTITPNETTPNVPDNYEEVDSLYYDEIAPEEEEPYENYEIFRREKNLPNSNKNPPQSPDNRRGNADPKSNFNRNNRSDEYEDDQPTESEPDTYLNEDDYASKNLIGTVAEEPSFSKDRLTTEKSSSGCHINFYTLPVNYESHPYNRFLDMDMNLYDSYQLASESFKNKILTLLNGNTDSISNKTSHSTPQFSKPISESEWLRNAGKLWDIIKKSPILFDYNKSVQSTNYKSSYFE